MSTGTYNEFVEVIKKHTPDYLMPYIEEEKQPGEAVCRCGKTRSGLEDSKSLHAKHVADEMVAAGLIEEKTEKLTAGDPVIITSPSSTFHDHTGTLIEINRWSELPYRIRMDDEKFKHPMHFFEREVKPLKNEGV